MLKIKPKLVADISNIAGYYNEFPPKIENIKIMYDTLKYEYYIIGIADWDLYKCINYRESYKYYLGPSIITLAPPGIKADKIIIMTAIQNDSLILTNDKLRDQEDLIPSESWIKNHRVAFKINNGEFGIHLPK